MAVTGGAAEIVGWLGRWVSGWGRWQWRVRVAVTSGAAEVVGGLVGWVVGWLAGWLAGWLVMTCTGDGYRWSR